MQTVGSFEQRITELERKFAAQLTALTAERDAIVAERDTVAAEREQYKKLYLEMLALCRKLELGIVGQKRERFIEGDSPQLTMSVIGMVTGKEAPSVPELAQIPAHPRQKPTGRKPLPEKLPRVDIEVLPPEVQQAGLDAYERIGEDVSETVERRPSSLVVVRVHKPKFALKGRDRLEATTVLQASPPELPIERGMAGPALLADTDRRASCRERV